MSKSIFNTDKELLRLATAGSVDDGKSTLIGRLFYDTGVMYEDQLKQIEEESKKRGNKEIDLSLFTDGLSAEREQGITIDVAYRYFDTEEKRIIIADVPGHEQYTRNMVTGISDADVVLILVDVKNGMTTQSKRHLFIASLLGVAHILVVVNKMDIVSYDKESFSKIKDEFLNYSSKLNIKDLQFIPTSSLKGDMVVERGSNMEWYKGDTVLHYLENVPPTSGKNLIDFRLPIQNVLRKDGKRFYAGKIEGGSIKENEKITILPSGEKGEIKNIYLGDQKIKEAFNPQSVCVSLNREIDISRGDMIVRENNLPMIGNEIETNLCWFSEEKLNSDRSYLIKHDSTTTRCNIKELKYVINVKNLHREKINTLKMNEIGRVSLSFNKELFFDTYSKNRNTGSFILIDEISKNTVAAGIIIDKGKKLEEQKRTDKEAPVLWLTGFSGSGKSTIADKLSKKFKERGVDFEHIDGDVMRESLSSDLGFSKEDRDKNIERVSFLASMLNKHGTTVIATFISPYKKHRELVRAKVKNFVEIFVDTPLEVCEKRDTKGLYKRARAGEIEFFTGISDVYERPEKADIILKTEEFSSDECVSKILDYLDKKIPIKWL